MRYPTFLLIGALAVVPAFGAKDQGIPPDAEHAKAALEKSTRHGEWVDVKLGDGRPLTTWVVYPEKKEKAGAVIVIHEIFGLTDWVRAVADQLAKDGFIALAPDMLSGMGPDGGGTASLGEDAGKTIRTLDPGTVVARLDAVHDYAVSLPSANGNVGVVGFCWGGGRSFGYAVAQPKLDAAVVYYGSAPGRSRRLRQDRGTRSRSLWRRRCKGQRDHPDRRGGDEEGRKELHGDAVRRCRPRILAPARRARRRQPESRQAGLAGDRRVLPQATEVIPSVASRPGSASPPSATHGPDDREEVALHQVQRSAGFDGRRGPISTNDMHDGTLVAFAKQRSPTTRAGARG